MVSQEHPETRVSRWVNRPEIIELGNRRYLVRDLSVVRERRALSWLGLMLVFASMLVFVVWGPQLLQRSLEAAAVFAVGVLGAVIAWRVPRWTVRRTLLELDMSNRMMGFPIALTNGSGAKSHVISIDDVDVLLFGLRQAPIEPGNPRSVEVDAFALYIRLHDGSLYPVIEACRDQGSTFAVAQFLRDFLDVHLKQVGRGWRE
jgi:hypothetical protein